MPNKDLILKLTPEEAAKYSLKDFASEVYSKKSSLRMLYPTGFDFVDQFPVTWDDGKPMESHDKGFLRARPSAYEDDFAFDKKDFQKGNIAWRESKMSNAIFVECNEND